MMPNNKLAIDVHQLSKSFGKLKVLDNFNIQVPEARIYGFLGPNGSGKTTTIRLICGLLTPDSGQGTCLGYNILTQSHEIKHNIGYMPQKFSLYEDLTVKENLDLISRMYQLQNQASSVHETIGWLGLEERANQLAGTLSGGWKQRLSLAAAIIHKPKLLLLDEPTAGVDPRARREFWNYIYRLVDTGITVLVSTHYMDEAERCHHIAYLFYGNLLIQGKPDEVINESGLSSYELMGELNADLAQKLQSLEEIEQVAYFGNTLKVTGSNAKKMEKALKLTCKSHKIAFHQIRPSLEDVFVNLTQEREGKL